jgi:hypothetical protein
LQSSGQEICRFSPLVQVGWRNDLRTTGERCASACTAAAGTVIKTTGMIPANPSYPNDQKEITMKTVIITILLALTLGSGVGLAEEPERIGVYDSRAIAIAWAGTEPFITEIKDLRARHQAAEEAGDAELAGKLAAEGQARQEQMHYQGFSTAPVDEILARFEEPVAVAMEAAGVTVILSRWDEEGLARHLGAERVDVTMELVLAMKPNERQLGFVKQIGDQQPIPLEELKKQLAEGH